MAKNQKPLPASNTRFIAIAILLFTVTAIFFMQPWKQKQTTLPEKYVTYSETTKPQTQTRRDFFYMVFSQLIKDHAFSTYRPQVANFFRENFKELVPEKPENLDQFFRSSPPTIEVEELQGGPQTLHFEVGEKLRKPSGRLVDDAELDVFLSNAVKSAKTDQLYSYFQLRIRVTNYPEALNTLMDLLTKSFAKGISRVKFVAKNRTRDYVYRFTLKPPPEGAGTIQEVFKFQHGYSNITTQKISNNTLFLLGNVGSKTILKAIDPTSSGKTPPIIWEKEITAMLPGAIKFAENKIIWVDREKETDSVGIRKRGEGDIGAKALDEFIADLNKEIE